MSIFKTSMLKYFVPQRKTEAGRPRVNFTNCFVPYVNLLHPMPNFENLDEERKKFGVNTETNI